MASAVGATGAAAAPAGGIAGAGNAASVGTDQKAPLAAGRALELAAAVLRRNPDTRVLLKADQRVPYGEVVEAMVLLQRAGAANVGFLTEAPPSPRGRP